MQLYLVRHVSQIDKRIAEAKKLGFEAAIGPKMKNAKKSAMLKEVSDIKTALNNFLEN